MKARPLGRAFKGAGLRQPGSLGKAKSYFLISQVVLCGMSMAVYPPAPASAGSALQANGSLPVIPAYLPVPPVMIWVPQAPFSPIDLSTSRVSKVEKILSPSLSANTQAPSIYFLSPEATL